MNKERKMIRVLHVQGGMERGGTESVIMNWYRSIDRKEIQFDFTTMQEHACAYDNEIKALGGNIYYVPARAKTGNLKHFFALYQCIKGNGPYHAVHSHMNFHGGLVAFAARLAGIRNVICHAHGTKDLTVQTPKRKIELAILRILMNICATDLLACGMEAGKFVFGPKAKFSLINNAVDLTKFRPPDRSTKILVQNIKKEFFLEDTLVLGHVGSFYEGKNHKFLVDIIEELKKRNIKFKFIFIGNGPLRKDIIDVIKEKGLQEYVVDLGLRDDVDLWFKVMDIFVYPSLHEGVPVALVEAQCSGIPCLISNTISPEVDLGLGLVKFISIDNAKAIWAEEIASNGIERITDKEVIKERIKIKGYFLAANIKKITEIYQTPYPHYVL
jgi:glycosyltransferase EpsF